MANGVMGSAQTGAVQATTQQKMAEGVENTKEDTELTKFNAKIALCKKIQY